MAKKNQKMVLVTGATGQIGSAIIRKLRDKGFPVRALTREPDQPAAHALVGHGTEVVRGDLSIPESLTRAMDGVFAVCGVETPVEEGVGTETQQGFNLANAAKLSGIRHIIYVSVAGADRGTGIPHFESKHRIEENIRNSGLQHTFLRPVFLMNKWLEWRTSIEEGHLDLPLSADTRLPMVAADDIGVFAAMALEHPGHWQGRGVEIAGDELSMSELADAFGRKAGRDVEYRQTPWDQFESQEGHAATLMYRWYQDGGFSVDISALRQEQPNITTFERWLQSNWKTAPQRLTARPS
jgi:uncharacterized protein YbjT (DUF2867 family)